MKHRSAGFARRPFLFPLLFNPAAYYEGMNANLEHISLNVSDPKVSFVFYKRLFKYFGYIIFAAGKGYIAFRKKGTPDFWLRSTEKKYLKNKFHRKNTGLNHLAWHAKSKKEVDQFTEKFLIPNRIKPLYGGPKLYPQYTRDYYAVYFEDPNRIKLEFASFKI